MRLFELENPSVDDIVNDLISRSGLDDNDRDMGTAGLCGMFAFALYRNLIKRGIPAKLGLICADGENGGPRDRRGELQWRHAVVEVNGKLYDVDGQGKLEDMIENYCWGNLYSEGVKGSLVIVSPTEFTKEMRDIRHSSVDARYLRKWKKQLAI